MVDLLYKESVCETKEITIITTAFCFGSYNSTTFCEGGLLMTLTIVN